LGTDADIHGGLAQHKAVLCDSTILSCQIMGIMLYSLLSSAGLLIMMDIMGQTVCTGLVLLLSRGELLDKPLNIAWSAG
jgi:hypothetical protein